VAKKKPIVPAEPTFSDQLTSYMEGINEGAIELGDSIDKIVEDLDAEETISEHQLELLAVAAGSIQANLEMLYETVEQFKRGQKLQLIK
jgi:hypothetical protein